MKKSKFITGLSAAFISAMALMSCSSLLKAKDGVILTIDGVEYTAEDLFNDQKTPAAAEAKFNAVFKVAVRAYFKKNTQYKDEIENETRIKINEQKATAQSNADKNGTSYNEEWQKILDANGVDDENGLRDKFEYDIQKEKFENKLYDNNYGTLRNGGKLKNESGEGIGEDVPGYLTNKQPYHIKHILVKIAGMKGSDGVSAEITADEAEKLSGVITKLAQGYDFADVSKNYNDDTTAKENGGSLGIMSRDTSFVNDFKLGIYLYESFYGSSTQAETAEGFKAKKAEKELFGERTGGTFEEGSAGYWADKIKALVEPSTTIDPATEPGIGIGQIPYQVALRLHDYARIDFDDARVKTKFEDADLSKDDVAAKFLPRNVIFNKYFNKHNIMVITPRTMHNYTATGTGISGKIDDWVDTSGKKRNDRRDLYLGKLDSTYLNTLDGFKRTSKNADGLTKNLPTETTGTFDSNVLRDENGRVILVFRSGTGDSSNDAYQGIHFVVIERSPFIGQEYDSDEAGAPRTEPTTLDEYYTEYYPGQSTGDVSKHHPVYGEYDPLEKDNDWKHTFVYYFKDTVGQNLKERADTVKGELKKCTDRLDTYIYDYLMKTSDIHFNDDPNVPIAKEIEKSITDWIKLTRTSKLIDDKKTWDDTWHDYYCSLEAQAEQRAEVLGKDDIIHSYLVPEACAIAFADFREETLRFDGGTEMLKKIFGKGGVFHE